MSRSLRLGAQVTLLAGVALVGATACRGDAASGPKKADDGQLAPIEIDPPVAARGSVPETVETFLERLIPLPSPAIEVTYEVSGPGGLEGTLEVSTRPGGWRREAWVLRVPMPESDDVATQIDGLTIQTPSQIWTAVGEEPGTVTPNQLEGLAQAYLDLDDEARRDVVAALDGWYARLAEAREEAPGERDTIAGQDCLETRVAAQNLCLWEQAGLPLRYAGSEFSLEAKAIDRHAEIADAAFELPPRAREAHEAPLPEAAVIDPKAAVDKLASGDYAPLALLLTPGFRVPTARND